MAKTSSANTLGILLKIPQPIPCPCSVAGTSVPVCSQNARMTARTHGQKCANKQQWIYYKLVTQLSACTFVAPCCRLKPPRRIHQSRALYTHIYFHIALITCEISLQNRSCWIFGLTKSSTFTVELWIELLHYLNNKCSCKCLYGDRYSALWCKPYICDYVYQPRDGLWTASEVCVRLHVEWWDLIFHYKVCALRLRVAYQSDVDSAELHR